MKLFSNLFLAFLTVTLSTTFVAGQEQGDICPITEGSEVPDVTVTTVDNEEISLRSLTKRQPTVFIFYRGGWCPYCNKHLKNVKQVEDDLIDMGYQIIAISPDKPSKLEKTLNKHEMDYQLYSDSDMEVSKAFGLNFQVSNATLKKYKLVGINLQKASGEEHEMLPVPAVYISDKKRNIRFAHANPNYKNRLDTEVMKAVAKAIR